MINGRRPVAQQPGAALPYGMQLPDTNLNVALASLALQPLSERDGDRDGHRLAGKLGKLAVQGSAATRKVNARTRRSGMAGGPEGLPGREIVSKCSIAPPFVSGAWDCWGRSGGQLIRECTADEPF